MKNHAPPQIYPNVKPHVCIPNAQPSNQQVKHASPQQIVPIINYRTASYLNKSRPSRKVLLTYSSTRCPPNPENETRQVPSGQLTKKQLETWLLGQRNSAPGFIYKKGVYARLFFSAGDLIRVTLRMPTGRSRLDKCFALSIGCWRCLRWSNV